MRRRGPPRRFSLAVLASAGLHALVLGTVWYSVSNAGPPPRPKVFRVDIVSPPPTVAGEPTPTAPAPENAAPEPEPEPAAPPPAPTPEPVAAEPAPAPPKRPEPRRPAPESRPTPAPRSEKPPEQAKSPSTTTARRTERPQETAKQTGEKKTEAPAARNPVAPTGRNPDAASPGGEGLAVRTEGAEFVDPAYLANIIRQLKRYFRPPPGARTDEATVQFFIHRDGSVSGIAVAKSRGGFPFRAAAMEAVEQAGLNRAFGPLPNAYKGDRLPVSFTFEPES